MRGEAEKARRAVFEKAANVVEAEGAQGEGGVYHVQLVAFGHHADFDEMAAADERRAGVEAEDVLGEAEVGRALGAEAGHAADVDVAGGAAAGHEFGEGAGGIGLNVLTDAGAAESTADVEEGLRG